MYRYQISLPFFLVLFLACFPACQGKARSHHSSGTGEISLSGTGIHLANANVTLDLLPEAKINGAWHGAGQDGPCFLDASGLHCPGGAYGTVTVQAPHPLVTVSFDANASSTVQALALTGQAHIPGAQAWISNGFQSWSKSGVLALGPPVSAADFQAAVTAFDFTETSRNGNELSWWYTGVGGGREMILTGVTDAVRFKSWIQVSQVGEEISMLLANGGAGENIKVQKGNQIAGEPWFLGGGTNAPELLAAYASSLPSRRFQNSTPPACGWNSWYQLWSDVNEPAIQLNVPLAAGLLDPVTPPADKPLYIIVDDGWEMDQGTWTPNAKFPSGMDGLAAQLRAQGFIPGIWLCPLRVDETNPLVTQHPDWFLLNVTTSGGFKVLDVTQPDAAAFLASTIQQLVGWGYSFLKIDFLFGGTAEAPRYEAMTGMEAYNRALSIIRTAAGPDVTLLAVGAPPIPSLRYVDGWRLGDDIALPSIGPAFPYVAQELRSLSARIPFCLAIHGDPDPALLRVMTTDEVDFGAWTVAAAGGAFFLSDDLTRLPSSRQSLSVSNNRVPLALSGVPACPESLFPLPAPATLASPLHDWYLGTDTIMVPVVWRMQDGRRIAFNATAQAMEVEGVTIPSHAVRELGAE